MTRGRRRTALAHPLTAADTGEVANPIPSRVPRIDLDHVSKHYRVGSSEVTALDDVSLHIDDAAFVVILGASGSGKTTLLNLIGALDTATAGSARVDGTVVTGASARRRAAFRRHSVSFIFQTFNLFPGLTALENVRFGADASRRPHPRDTALAAIERVGLGGRRDHFPHQLSGGEQQRVALARAFMNRPKILFCDEPTGNLDGDTAQAMVELIFGLNHEKQTTLVLVTHDLELARRCQRILRLKGGAVVSDSVLAHETH